MCHQNPTVNITGVYTLLFAALITSVSKNKTVLVETGFAFELKNIPVFFKC